MVDTQAVIDAGHPPVADKVVLVDFDGTLFPFGDLMGDAPPLRGAAAAMQKLKSAGYKVVIFTSRLSPTWWESEGMHPREAYREQVKYITDICQKWDIPFDDITAEKVPAEAYFDDKAVRVGEYNPLLYAVQDYLYLKRGEQ